MGLGAPQVHSPLMLLQRVPRYRGQNLSSAHDMATPAPTRSLEQEKKKTWLMRITPSHTQYYAVFPGKYRQNGKGKKKATYTFASSFVAYVTLTTAVSVSVLTGGEARRGALGGRRRWPAPLFPAPSAPRRGGGLTQGVGAQHPSRGGAQPLPAVCTCPAPWIYLLPGTRSSKGDALRWAEVATQSLSCQQATAQGKPLQASTTHWDSHIAPYWVLLSGAFPAQAELGHGTGALGQMRTVRGHLTLLYILHRPVLG